MLDAPAAKTREARLDALLLRAEIDDFNAAYAAALDEQRLSDWAEMFTEDAFYVVISRENADRGLPVGLIYCDSKKMIHDRAFALEKTTMFAPRYLRHIIGNLQVLGETADGGVRAHIRARGLDPGQYAQQPARGDRLHLRHGFGCRGQVPRRGRAQAQPRLVTALEIRPHRFGRSHNAPPIIIAKTVTCARSDKNGK